MTPISSYLEKDHRHCDELQMQVEAMVAARNWGQAEPAFQRFSDSIEGHLHKEERVLFPQLERASGNACGPTHVMRGEHAQMRAIIGDMAAAIAERDSDSYFDHADTLRMLGHQHNMKEEAVLYPMAERLLGGGAAALLETMEAVGLAHDLAEHVA